MGISYNHWALVQEFIGSFKTLEPSSFKEARKRSVPYPGFQKRSVKQRRNRKVVCGAMNRLAEERGDGEALDFRVSFFRRQRDGIRDDDLSDFGARAEPLDGVSRKDTVRSGDINLRFATMREKCVHCLNNASARRYHIFDDDGRFSSDVAGKVRHFRFAVFRVMFVPDCKWRF